MAKNSATRNQLDIDFEGTDDLYKLSLKKMLEKTSNFCAIIPHSFLSQDKFKENLWCVRILNCVMFDDTEHPVCLAFFLKNKEETGLSNDDFYIYKDETYIRFGSITEKYEALLNQKDELGITMNVEDGEIGFRCIDNNITNDIRMVNGYEITSPIKHSSRSVTRMSIDNFDVKNVDKFIDTVNEFIEEFREETDDVFLTAFKGLKKDGNYRMRISFSLIKKIINFVYKELYNE